MRAWCRPAAAGLLPFLLLGCAPPLVPTPAPNPATTAVILVSASRALVTSTPVPPSPTATVTPTVDLSATAAASASVVVATDTPAAGVTHSPTPELRPTRTVEPTFTVAPTDTPIVIPTPPPTVPPTRTTAPLVPTVPSTQRTPAPTAQVVDLAHATALARNTNVQGALIAAGQVQTYAVKVANNDNLVTATLTSQDAAGYHLTLLTPDGHAAGFGQPSGSVGLQVKTAVNGRAGTWYVEVAADKDRAPRAGYTIRADVRSSTSGTPAPAGSRTATPTRTPTP